MRSLALWVGAEWGLKRLRQVNATRLEPVVCGVSGWKSREPNQNEEG